jgi:hypothetical protein
MGDEELSGRGRRSKPVFRVAVAMLPLLTTGALFLSGSAQAASAWPTACGPEENGSVIGCATVAPAGGTMSEVTLYDASTQNEGFEVSFFEIWTVTAPTNIQPSACSAQGTTVGTNGTTYFVIKCSEKVAPGSSAQVCFDGGGFTGDGPNGNGTPPWVTSPPLPNDRPTAWPVGAVSGCTAANTSSSGGASTGPSKASKCVVPNVKGDKASTAAHAIVRAGCKVGTVKHVRSSRAKNGIVLTQSPRAGGRGPKVNLDVGKV